MNNSNIQTEPQLYNGSGGVSQVTPGAKPLGLYRATNKMRDNKRKYLNRSKNKNLNESRNNQLRFLTKPPKNTIGFSGNNRDIEILNDPGKKKTLKTESTNDSKRFKSTENLLQAKPGTVSSAQKSPLQNTAFKYQHFGLGQLNQKLSKNRSKPSNKEEYLRDLTKHNRYLAQKYLDDIKNIQEYPQAVKKYKKAINYRKKPLYNHSVNVGVEKTFMNRTQQLDDSINKISEIRMPQNIGSKYLHTERHEDSMSHSRIKNPRNYSEEVSKDSGTKMNTSSVFQRLYAPDVKRNRGMSLQCLHKHPENKFSSSKVPSTSENVASKLHRARKISKTRSNQEFYQSMQRLEEQRKQRIMKLLIDKENKEISELKKGVSNKRARSHQNSQTRSEGNLSVHNKLYVDSKIRTVRMNQTKEKHKNKEFSSLSNDSDNRNKFFVPKINKNSMKILGEKGGRRNANMSVQELLFDYAKQRKKAQQIEERFYENQSRQIANRGLKENVLPKSRKLLYENFLKKFNNCIHSLGVTTESTQPIDYQQYLTVIKHLIYLDQKDESTISESREIFEGWKTMNGHNNGYITVESFRDFMIKTLNLKPVQTSKSKMNTSRIESSYHTDFKVDEKPPVPYSEINLLKANEDEVRLNHVEENKSMTSIQKLYKNIKSGRKSGNKLLVDKKVKSFLNITLKSNEQLIKKQNIKDKLNMSGSKLNESNLKSRALGNVVYDHIKNEMLSTISKNNVTSDDHSMSTERASQIEAVDILLFRGEQYKQNRLKLKEQLNNSKSQELTFVPNLQKGGTSLAQKEKKGNLRKAKHKMNHELMNYITRVPPQLGVSDDHREENSIGGRNRQTSPSIIVPENDQQSKGVRNGDPERLQDQLENDLVDIVTDEQPNVAKTETKSENIKIIEDEIVRRDIESKTPYPENEESESSEERFPVLFLDVNLGGGRVKRLVIKDGDDSMKVASEFCAQHNLSAKKERKLKNVIQKQLAGVLTKIKEEESDY